MKVFENNYFAGISDVDWTEFINKQPDYFPNWDLKLDAYSTIYVVNNQSFQIPYRLGYKNEKYCFGNKIEYLLSLCILSRNPSGFIRQKAVVQLFEQKEFEQSFQFCFPYIIRLCGEYVSEIWDIIYDKRDLFSKDKIVHFREENKSFIQKNYDRAITYWYEYYRDKYSSYKQTSSFKLFKWINLL